MIALVQQKAIVTSGAEAIVGSATQQSESDLQASARRTRTRNTFWVWVGRLILAIFVFGGWQLFTDLKWVDPFFYGQPSMVWDSLVNLFTKGTAFGSIWDQLWVTVQEALFGFLFGTIAGVISGILLGSNRYLSNVFSPYIKVLNSIPRIVLGSIFIVAFGLGIGPKILLAAVLVFFAVFFNAYQGVREVDQNLIANVRVLGASPLQIARHVTIPSAMTWIIASLHTAFGFAIIGALVAEVLGAQKGIGLIISQSQGRFDPNTVFACMAIIAVFTLGAEYLITLLERSVLRWRPPVRSESQPI
ncbi:ABC transporter permease [Cryobacterium algoritolerans]|uniref:ABC transporter permease n=1 Tax=Cryobacterium algoritolerans TaxID=1259184 RepID=A0A4R8WVU7_9MICO|nr:ABC transporter permease [Cryobacterium algoritolerans]TFC17433.1 ABC transporter permease [Cryobacterium algoritolerans]